MELKLYEITEDIRNILLTDEWTDDTENQLAALEMSLEKKAGNIVYICAELEAFVEAAKAEEKRISERRKAAMGRVQRLKEYTKHCMEAAERDEIETGTHKIRLQQNNPKVVVDAEENIPPQFFTIIPATTQLDKKALADALKKGEVIVGAHLERGTSLRIR